MIIYLYGPDSYQRQEKLNWYIQKFKEKHSALTVDHFNLEEADELPRLKDFASAQSLFVNYKFGVLNNTAESEPEDLKGVFKLANESKTLTLAISTDAKLPAGFTKLFGKETKKEEFKTPEGAPLLAFIRAQAAKRGLKLNTDASKAIAASHKNSTWAIITEIDKLAAGGRPEPVLQEQNFFMLLNRAKRNDLAAVTYLLETEEPAKVFNILASQNDSQLKTKMADYDAAIKAGKFNYEEALLDLALSH